MVFFPSLLSHIQSARINTLINSKAHYENCFERTYLLLLGRTTLSLVILMCRILGHISSDPSTALLEMREPGLIVIGASSDIGLAIVNELQDSFEKIYCTYNRNLPTTSKRIVGKGI